MRIYEDKSDAGVLTIDVTVTDDKGVEVEFYDISRAAKEATGGSDYERKVTIPPDHVANLAMHLLADRFTGDIKTQSKVEAYCKERGIETRVWSW